MTDSPTDVADDAAIDYPAVQASPHFRRLRRTQRRFVFPLAVFFLLWYSAYVVLAAFFPGVMAQQVWGHVTLGLVLGLGQFVTTFAITMAYVSFANRRLDPLSAAIRTDLENGGGRA